MTVVTLGGVVGEPRFKMGALGLLREGDRVALKARLKRPHQGRLEALVVVGEWKVVSAIQEAGQQSITVEVLGASPPRWVAIKKEKVARVLGPTRFPKERLR